MSFSAAAVQRGATVQKCTLDKQHNQRKTTKSCNGCIDVCDAVSIFTLLFSVHRYACTEINMLLDLTAFALLRLIFKTKLACVYIL